MSWGGLLARFYRPGGGGFELFFARGVGNSPIKKIARGFCRGGGEWSGLELTDTLCYLLTSKKVEGSLSKHLCMW